jgi:hypothetical protein
METLKENNGLINGRDNNGKFIPGHRLFSGSNGIKNGRKKTFKGEVEDALSLAENAMPDIIRGLIGQAKSGHVQAAMYLIDRVYGKPSQSLQHTATINVEGKPLLIQNVREKSDAELMEIIIGGRDGGTRERGEYALQEPRGAQPVYEGLQSTA